MSIFNRSKNIEPIIPLPSVPVVGQEQVGDIALNPLLVAENFFIETKEPVDTSRAGWAKFDNRVSYYTGFEYTEQVNEAISDIYGLEDDGVKNGSTLSLTAATRRFTKASAEMIGVSTRYAVDQYEGKPASKNALNVAMIANCTDVVDGIVDSRLAALCDRVGFGVNKVTKKGFTENRELTNTIFDHAETIQADRTIASAFAALITTHSNAASIVLDSLDQPEHAALRKSLLTDFINNGDSAIKQALAEAEEKIDIWTGDYTENIRENKTNERVKSLVDFALLSVVSITGVTTSSEQLVQNLLHKEYDNLPAELIVSFSAFRRQRCRALREKIVRTLGHENEILNSWRAPVTKQDRQAAINLFNYTLSDDAMLRRVVDEGRDPSNQRSAKLSSRDFDKIINRPEVATEPLEVQGINRQGLTYSLDQKYFDTFTGKLKDDVIQMIDIISREPYGDGSKKLIAELGIKIDGTKLKFRRFSPMERNGFSAKSKEGRHYRAIYAVDAQAKRVLLHGIYSHEEFDKLTR